MINYILYLRFENNQFRLLILLFFFYLLLFIIFFYIIITLSSLNITISNKKNIFLVFRLNCKFIISFIIIPYN